MQCLCCGRSVKPQSGFTLQNSLFPSCPMCGQPFVYTHQEGRYLAQCAQCGMALSGPYQGVQHIDKTGKPDLSIGVSHGLCKDCADTILLRWRSKKRRLTKNLAS